MSRNFELLRKIELEREIRERESQNHLRVDDNVSVCVSNLKQADIALPHLTIDGPARAEINKLVQHLFIQPGGSRVVVFSAVQSGDGCSWITARAAATLAARVEGSVCVVDANFRSPSLHDYFSIDNSRGLRNILSRTASLKTIAQRILPTENLWVITSGSLHGNEESWLSLFRQHAGEICREFDYVLFDAPPLAHYSDAIAIASAAADGIALVIQPNSTPRHVARRVAEDIEKASGRLLGAVVNRGESTIPELVYRWLPVAST